MESSLPIFIGVNLSPVVANLSHPYIIVSMACMYAQVMVKSSVELHTFSATVRTKEMDRGEGVGGGKRKYSVACVKS